MLTFYPQILAVHLWAAGLSGLWLAARGGAALAGQRWPFALSARLAGWLIDGCLLTAATMLVAILPPALFANGWLWTKLPAVAVYLGCGWLAMAGERRRSSRWPLLMAAFAAYLWVIGVALRHQPLGWFAAS